MADLISSGKIIQKPEIVVDPSFFLPPGVVDARYKTREEVANPNDGYAYGGDSWSGGGGGASTPELTEVPIDGETPVVPGEGSQGGAPTTENNDLEPWVDPPVFMPPTGFVVVDQTIKFAPDGTMTVDVTLEFPDVPNADGYDIRLTKIGEVEGVVIPASVTPVEPVGGTV